MSCVICNGEKVSNLFCSYHEMAYKNIVEKYGEWVKRYGELEWKEFLRISSRLDVNGIWVRDVARFLLEKG